jgi:hypothetical protein
MVNIEIQTYFFFIIYLVVLFYDNIIAILDTINGGLSQLRNINHIIVPILTLYMLLNFKLTKSMSLIVFVWFIGVIRYWLFTYELIYRFIEKTPQNVNFVNKYMNYDLSIVLNLTMIVIEFYCLYFIFKS